MTTARYSHPSWVHRWGDIRDIGLIGTRDRKLAVQYVLKERLLVIAVRGHLVFLAVSNGNTSFPHGFLAFWRLTG